MSRILRIYQQCLRKNFILTNAVQTGVLMASGDVIAQCIVEGKSWKQYEIKRTLQFAGLGTVAVGPILAVWYKTLAKYVGTSGTTVALKKVALDQLLFAPSFLAFFLASLNVLQGKSMDHLMEEYRYKYTDIVIMNWKVWPAVQMCNFYIVPLHYQVLLVQVVALFWNAYLSWKTQKEIRERQHTMTSLD